MRQRKTNRRLTLIGAVLIAATLCGPNAARACPSCSEALPNELPTQNSLVTSGPGTAKGYAWSILLMIGMPYTLAGGIGTAIYWQYRQRNPKAPTS